MTVQISIKKSVSKYKDCGGGLLSVLVVIFSFDTTCVWLTLDYYCFPRCENDIK